MNRHLSAVVTVLVIVSLVVSQFPVLAQEAATNPVSGVVTVDQLRALYPTAELRQVTMQEFQALTNDPAGNVQVVVEPQATTGRFGMKQAPEGANETPRPRWGTSTTNQALGVVEGEGPYRGRSASPYRQRPTHGYYDTDVVTPCMNIYGTIEIDDADIAVVLFVIVGVVVVAAAVVYSLVFVAGALTHDGDEFHGWWDGGLRSHFFFGGDRAGGMYGLQMAGGFLTPEANVGLALEVGYIHGKVKVEDADDSVDVSNAYGITGPTVSWVLDESDNPMMLDLQLLAGISGDENLDWLSRAEVGFSWGMGPVWRMGLSIGSLFMQVSTTEGPATTDSSFNLSGGINVGRGF